MMLYKKVYYLLRGGSNFDKFIKGGGEIGADCEINPDTRFGSEPWLIRIGNRVRITANVQFITHDGAVWCLRNLYPELRDADLFGRISIGDNVHIGMNSIIMPGVTIGSNVIIGSGTIVTRSVPDNSVVAGVPGRVIKTIGEYRRAHESAFIHTKTIVDPAERKAAILRKMDDPENASKSGGYSLE